MIRNRMIGMLVLGVLFLSFPPFAAGTGGREMEPANNVLGNVRSLQRGAKNFVNYCMGCHSAKYVRYNRLADDLQLSEQQVTENLMFVGEKLLDTMDIAMDPLDAGRWFGQVPPDLSLIARAKGTDYVFNYLKGFYLDPDRRNGTDNLFLPGASMPHVLWELQGLQKPVYEAIIDANGGVHKVMAGFEQVTEGLLSPEEYDQFVRDLANFLEYISEPVKLERQELGVRVLLFLLVFFLFSYMLKQEYWKDIK
ncbi:MAG: cytochrome c1 [Gammaproteobacteria bacterium]|nr:cytochrome c1 [Gammaproteobacteria bacterium]MCZ6911960.1 cytochrome c1 [Pseudomonadota bacterium]